MGFVYRESMFQLLETLEQPVHLILFVQKNVHGETYQAGPELLIRSPLLNTPRRRVLLTAHVLASGIRFHAPREVWWPTASLPEALAALKLYVLPWYRVWSSPSLLLEKIETSIEKRESLINVVEPLSPEQEDAMQRVWPRVFDTKPAVPVISYFSASVLHHMVGNREMAIQRTEDWFNRLSPNDQAERAEAMEQLSALKQMTVQ